MHTCVYEVDSGGEREQIKSEARSMRGMVMNLKERKNHVNEHKAFKEPIAMLTHTRHYIHCVPINCGA